MEVTTLTWALTVLLIVGLIAADLFTHRNTHAISLRQSAISSLLWTALGVAFTAVIFWLGSGATAGQYFTGYLLERALSVDNVLVFVVILSYFAVPVRLQHHALLWGVVMALVLRAIFIAVGATLLDTFAWTTYVFGAILLFTAYKLAVKKEGEVDPAKNVVLKTLRRVVPVTDDFEDTKLVSRKSAKRFTLTPLAAVLIVIGTTDLAFAVDSVPAVFGVTREPFIVFTANAFSMLGLRPLTALLSAVVDRLVYLQPALAIVLGMVGLEMIFEHFYEPPTWLPLVAIAVVLTGAVVLSLRHTAKTSSQPASAETGDAR